MLEPLGAAIADGTPQQFWIFFTVLALVAVAAAFFGFGRLRESRLIEDTPTSRIRSAAQGYVELEGFARLLPGPQIVSPLSRANCVWWRYQVEHRRSYDDGKQRRSEWETVRKVCSEELFLLADDSGSCIVDPFGAQVLPSLRRRWQGRTPWPIDVPAKTPWFSAGDYRYSEELVGIGDPLYALGGFRSQSAVVSEDEARDVRELLADWKRNHRELLRRFDRSGDGQLSVEEWDAARAAAIAEVRGAQLERSLDPDLHVLHRPADGRRFLISTLSQAALAGRLRWGATALIAISLAAAISAIWLAVHRLG